MSPRRDHESLWHAELGFEAGCGGRIKSVRKVEMIGSKDARHWDHHDLIGKFLDGISAFAQ
jgi:hypothetical protein